MNSTGILLGLAGLFGAVGVAAGAAAAHGLPWISGERAVYVLEVAVRYQLWHALAMAVAVLLYGGPGLQRSASTAGHVWFLYAAWLFAVGIILFCGALYLSALHAPQWTVHAAPIGGGALILGWLVLGLAGFRTASLKAKP